MTLAGAYLWTEYCSGSRWSWMQAMGKNSLMVYWVHVMIVYGALAQPFEAGSFGRTERARDDHRHADDGLALGVVAEVESPQAGQGAAGGVIRGRSRQSADTLPDRSCRQMWRSRSVSSIAR